MFSLLKLFQIQLNFAFFLLFYLFIANSALEQQSLDLITDALENEELKKCGEQTNGDKNDEKKKCEIVRNAFNWLVSNDENKMERRDEIKKKIDDLFVEKYNLANVENDSQKLTKRHFEQQLRSLKTVNLITIRLHKNSKTNNLLEKFAKTLQQMENRNCLEADLIVFTKAIMLLPKLKSSTDDEMNNTNEEGKQNKAERKSNKRNNVFGFINPHRRSKRCNTLMCLCCCIKELNNIGDKCFNS